MRKNLDTADKLVKLVLALLLVISYFAGIISGPIARALMLLGLVIILVFTVRAVSGFVLKR